MNPITSEATADGDAAAGTEPAEASAAESAADGRATRWADHRSKRRAELLRLVRHAITENGEGLSMEQISVLTHTSKPVLYRYFTDRAGLQAACGEWAMSTIERSLLEADPDTAEPRARLHAMVRAFVGLAAGAPSLYRFCTAAVSGAPADGFFSSVTELLCRSLGLRSHEQREWAWGGIGFVRLATENWLAHPSDPDEFATRLTRWLGASLAEALKTHNPEGAPS